MKYCLIITTYMKLMVMDFAVSSAMEHHPTANHKPGNMEEQTHVHQLHFLPIRVLDLQYIASQIIWKIHMRAKKVGVLSGE